MQQIVYAMQFKGKATPVEDNAGVINVQAVAASASITTGVNSGAITGGFDPAALADAKFESQGDAGHALRFTTVGQGWMGPSPDAAQQQGTVTWEL